MRINSLHEFILHDLVTAVESDVFLMNAFYLNICRMPLNVIA